IFRRLAVPQAPQALRDHVLQVRLPSIDYVVDRRRRRSKRRSTRVILAARRPPNLFTLPRFRPFRLIKIFAQQPELPKLVRTILPNISDRTSFGSSGCWARV